MRILSLQPRVLEKLLRQFPVFGLPLQDLPYEAEERSILLPFKYSLFVFQCDCRKYVRREFALTKLGLSKPAQQMLVIIVKDPVEHPPFSLKNYSESFPRLSNSFGGGRSRAISQATGAALDTSPSSSLSSKRGLPSKGSQICAEVSDTAVEQWHRRRLTHHRLGAPDVYSVVPRDSEKGFGRSVGDGLGLSSLSRSPAVHSQSRTVSNGRHFSA